MRSWAAGQRPIPKDVRAARHGRRLGSFPHRIEEAEHIAIIANHYFALPLAQAVESALRIRVHHVLPSIFGVAFGVFYYPNANSERWQ
jgi:hypothetical protein